MFSLDMHYFEHLQFDEEALYRKSDDQVKSTFATLAAASIVESMDVIVDYFPK